MAIDYPPQFPDEFAPIKEKEKDSYGMKYAYAAYSIAKKSGSRAMFNDQDFDALMELAQGRQSVDNIKKLFGYYNLEEQDADGGASDLSYIDIQILNLAPKYINRAVGRLQAIKYDIAASVLDPLTIDQEREYKSQLKAFFDLKKWMEKIGIPSQKLFPKLDISNVPEEPDEYLYEIKTNPKIKKAIRTEKVLKGLHYKNNWNQVSREVDWDFVVFGKGYVHCFLDENGIPKEEHLNPRYVVHPYSDHESHDNMDYIGFIEYISVQQFIKETEGKIKKSRQKEIIEEYGKDTNYESAGEYGSIGTSYDGIKYIPVFRYYFISQDRVAHDIKTNQYGNKIKKTRNYDYVPPKDQEELYKEGGPNRIIRNTYDSLYGGTWIVDSEVAYNHRRIEWPRSNMVDVELPIKAFSPNYKGGRTVSLAAQMIEPIYMINVAWNKVKDILAKGWMGIREINFDELEKVALGKGGATWDARKVYEHFLKTNTLIKRGKTNIYDQSNGAAVTESNTGLMLADYFTTISTSLRLLDDLTGTSSFEGSQPPERLAVGVAQANLQATHETMEYLYNAHHQIYLKSSETMWALAQMSHTMGNRIAGYAHGDVYEMDDEIASCDAGIMLERQPTEQEWAEFYAELSQMVKNQQIRPSDSAFIRDVDNLKEARRVLAIREEKYQRIKEKEMAKNEESQIRIAQTTAKAKMDSELAKLQAKGKIEQQTAVINGQIQGRVLEKEYAFKFALEGRKGDYNKLVAEQQGKDRIITQGLKNQVEREKVDKRPDKSPED